MDTKDTREIERIENAIWTLIYGANLEHYKEAKERGLFVLENILGKFPNGLFKQYPELDMVYQKIVLKREVAEQ